jgi:hypothetical protein
MSSGSIRRPRTSSVISHDGRSKTCTLCHKMKRAEEFSPSPKGLLGRDAYCKQCRRERYQNSPEMRARNKLATATYRKKHREKLAKKNKERYKKLKADLIRLYGSQCACCGETSVEFLALDHVHRDGTFHRAFENPKSLYARLVKENRRLSEYRLLCHNCTCSLGFYGYCPHEEER